MLFSKFVKISEEISKENILETWYKNKEKNHLHMDKKWWNKKNLWTWPKANFNCELPWREKQDDRIPGFQFTKLRQADIRTSKSSLKEGIYDAGQLSSEGKHQKFQGKVQVLEAGSISSFSEVEIAQQADHSQKEILVHAI